VVNIYDVIILGSGVTGYSAAIYSARFGLKTLVIGTRFGGLLQDTNIVENYPGYKSISGLDLMKKFKEHVEDYDIDMVEDEVKDVKKIKNCFSVKGKKSYKGKTLIFATGSKRRKLDVKGVEEFEGKGVSYCALCDGPLFKNKTVCVIGGSDSAAKEALLLSEYTKKVYIIYRKEKIRAEPINLERVNKSKKIEVINNTNIVEAKGSKFVEKVVLDKNFKGSKELKLDAIFIEIGQIPESELAKKLGVKLNKKGEIIIDCDSRTNVEGVCAAGDVADKEFKQAITGASEGVIAAFNLYEYLK
tara:strand:+ start:2292 stop:3197 length:906 start_codon:yes stop_codon:yes gene_type:complete